MLLLCVFQDALGAEHLMILDTVELDLLGGVTGTVLNGLGLDAGLGGVRCTIVVLGGHREARQDLVVDGEVVGVDLV